MPARAPKAKKAQIAAMGARVEVIEGTRQTVSEAALAASEEIFYASHNWQPYFIEGTKTLAFEIWEQSGFSVPDNIVVPLGYGSNVIGLYLGFQELTARARSTACQEYLVRRPQTARRCLRPGKPAVLTHPSMQVRRLPTVSRAKNR